MINHWSEHDNAIRGISALLTADNNEHDGQDYQSHVVTYEHPLAGSLTQALLGV